MPGGVARTIVITVPTTARNNLFRRQTFNPVVLGKRAVQKDHEENNDPFAGIQPPRKRERLTHLSPEEKLNRRKLKNRVAAQTARDRKKVRTCTLEDTVHSLVKDNQKLQADNASLRQALNALKEENERMKKKAEEEGTFGSAAGSSAPLDAHLHLAHSDLQTILDDLLQGSEHLFADLPETDAPFDHLQRAIEEPEFDAGAAEHADAVVEGAETQTAAAALLNKLEEEEEEESSNDAFISGLELPHSDQQITQRVPHSPPCLSPSSPALMMPLLDADLLDKAMHGEQQDEDDLLFHSDPLMQGAIWEDTFTDLFELVA